MCVKLSKILTFKKSISMTFLWYKQNSFCWSATIRLVSGVMFQIIKFLTVSQGVLNAEQPNHKYQLYNDSDLEKSSATVRETWN